MQTEGVGPGANDHASIHLIFVAHQSVKESILYGLVGDLEKTPFLFLRRLQFSRGDMRTQW